MSINPYYKLSLEKDNNEPLRNQTVNYKYATPILILPFSVLGRQKKAAILSIAVI